MRVRVCVCVLAGVGNLDAYREGQHQAWALPGARLCCVPCTTPLAVPQAGLFSARPAAACRQRQALFAGAPEEEEGGGGEIGLAGADALLTQALARDWRQRVTLDTVGIGGRREGQGRAAARRA